MTTRKNDKFIEKLEQVKNSLKYLTPSQLLAIAAIMDVYFSGVKKANENIFEDADKDVKGKKISLKSEVIEDDDDDDSDDEDTYEEDSDDELEDINVDEDEDSDEDEGDDDEDSDDEEEDDSEEEDDEDDSEEEDDEDSYDDSDDDFDVPAAKVRKASKKVSKQVSKQVKTRAKRKEKAVTFDEFNYKTWVEANMKKMESVLRSYDVDVKLALGKLDGAKRVKKAISVAKDCNVIADKLDDMATRTLFSQAKKAKLKLRGRTEKTQRESAINQLYALTLKAKKYSK